MTLKTGTRLGPYEIQSPLALAVWEKSVCYLAMEMLWREEGFSGKQLEREGCGERVKVAPVRRRHARET